MSTPDPATFEFIREMLGTVVPFATHVGVVVEAVGDGTASTTLPDTEATKNHVGTQHAGALFTAAEAASGAAMAGALAPFVAEAMSVVKQATSRYAKPARGSITATATTTRPASELRAEFADVGRTVFSVHVALIDTDEITVAEMDFDWVVTAPR